MAIDWTPWFNVPLHRRLELFSVALLNSCGLLLPTVILFSVFYIIVSRKLRFFYRDYINIITQTEFHWVWHLNLEYFVVLRQHFLENNLCAVFGIHLLWPTHSRSGRKRRRVRIVNVKANEWIEKQASFNIHFVSFQRALV